MRRDAPPPAGPGEQMTRARWFWLNDRWISGAKMRDEWIEELLEAVLADHPEFIGPD